MPRNRLALAPLALLAAAASWVAADWYAALPADRQASYLGRQSCAACHAPQMRAWEGSHHDKAMDFATPETVLGNFDNQEFTHFGVTSRMFRDGEKYMIHTEGADGQLHDFQIKYVFGVEPLQQYMVEFPDGRVQVLSIAWDTKQGRWFDLHPEERIPPTDELHWTRPAQNWNYMCAECHSTNLQKNYDLATDTFHTTWSEIDVSCEACHGPGSIHVELASSKKIFWDRNHGYGLARLKGPSSKAELETCARCHSRRRIVHPDYSPGRELLDYYEPELLRETLYQPDGQIEDEVYEYGSFLQSRMHREGVRCSDCHDPHTVGKPGQTVKREGNKLCTHCHTPNKGNYDSPAHHHHQVGSKGALCVECHMPVKNYMVVDPRRDHSLRIPRPDLSAKYGVTNACQACHADKPVEWSRDQVARWYAPGKQPPPHFAEALAAGRARAPHANAQLIQLLDNRSTDKAKAVASIVRATAASLLDPYGGEDAREAVERALDDDEPLVRVAAVRSLDLVRDLDDFHADRLRKLVVPRLEDPIRTVRAEAARVLARVPGRLFTREERDRLQAGLQEWMAGPAAAADRADAHLSVAIVYERLRQTDRAVQEYHTAIRLDPLFWPARTNLAMLEHLRGNDAEAEKQYREVIRTHPQLDEAHFSLGLLLIDKPDRRTEALAALAKAAELSPRSARMQFYYGQALLEQGRTAEARAPLEAAVALEPEAIESLQTLALAYAELREADKALAAARRVVSLDPSQRAFLEHVEQALARPKTLGPALPRPAVP